MDWRKNWKALAAGVAVFLCAYHLPVGRVRFDNAILEALALVKWYAREHVILCLVPAFFIAGAIAVFVSRDSVMKYLGAGANKVTAYAVASVSGSVLAVCSCTVLPLFAGIYRMGAGLGPAAAFLYSAPAINILAILLTGRVLGVELGVARAVGAVLFSLLIGLAMQVIFRKEESARAQAQAALPEPVAYRPLGRTAAYFASMVGILVFANWGRPEESSGLWYSIYTQKWLITAGFAAGLGLMLSTWFGLGWPRLALAAVPSIVLALLFPGRPLIVFAAAVVGLSAVTSTHKGEPGEWFVSSWDLARQILPLLFLGVLAAGALLGRPGREGLIPPEWIGSVVGGNSLQANLFASAAGALMYFATLTEVPILEGLIGGGMGKGPALALLLAGPALSLPNMLVIRSVMGTQKTAVFISLVIVMAAAAGMVYGAFL